MHKKRNYLKYIYYIFYKYVYNYLKYIYIDICYLFPSIFLCFIFTFVHVYIVYENKRIFKCTEHKIKTRINHLSACIKREESLESATNDINFYNEKCTLNVPNFLDIEQRGSVKAGTDVFRTIILLALFWSFVYLIGRYSDVA